MSINSDNLILVAPRPVRLAAPTPFSSFNPSFLHRPQPSKVAAAVRYVSAPSEAFDRLKLSDNEDDPSMPSHERDRPISPRASPLSTPPSEAIEEFLSILRPSFAMFPPTSPILRPTNGVAHGFVPYRQALSPAMSNEGLGLCVADQGDNASKENDLVSYPFRLLSPSPLSSPVIRARNPFPRHQALEGQVSAFIAQRSTSSTPSPVSMTLSPAAIPLPPTPDEMDREIS
ncbi:hypothetical protein BDY19DRAFT_292559 [Irpex rosettiformis]|uniref:Uncharacterized protein n=1 Tax=Irpex rosettiformis TaxID=378272 RepID=A0ACB8UI13_9APHY|nr:hypothetical protein BDY19DRAFT_292559 [Irpex rosettiformis]